MSLEDWDPFKYEEKLTWNEPDPDCLEQLRLNYEAEDPYEDGQFDDAKSDYVKDRMKVVKHKTLPKLD